MAIPFRNPGYRKRPKKKIKSKDFMTKIVVEKKSIVVVSSKDIDTQIETFEVEEKANKLDTPKKVSWVIS